MITTMVFDHGARKSDHTSWLAEAFALATHRQGSRRK